MTHSPRALVKSPMKNFRHTYDLLSGAASISGRLSLSEHPWLADHKVFDRVILAGTGMVELALAAGLAVGSPRVLELTLAVPLVVPARGRVAGAGAGRGCGCAGPPRAFAAQPG